MFRTALVSTSRTIRPSYVSRAFHTSPVASRTVTEKVSQAAQDVNIKVGKSLASAIEKGEQATEATKQAVGGSSVKEVADNVNKKLGRGVASGIEKGEQATETTKQTLESATAKSKQAAGVAGQKANQATAGAREGKEDFKKDVQKEIRK